MTADTGRPQDQGRPHRKAGRPSAATASLLAEYQEAMRAELRGVLVELAGVTEPPGLGLTEPIVKRPSLGDRVRLWDLAIKLGRELGTEVDRPAAVAGTPAPIAPRRGGPRRGRVDMG